MNIHSTLESPFVYPVPMRKYHPLAFSMVDSRFLNRQWLERDLYVFVGQILYGNDNVNSVLVISLGGIDKFSAFDVDGNEIPVMQEQADVINNWIDTQRSGIKNGTQYMGFTEVLRSQISEMQFDRNGFVDSIRFGRFLVDGESGLRIRDEIINIVNSFPTALEKYRLTQSFVDNGAAVVNSKRLVPVAL